MAWFSRRSLHCFGCGQQQPNNSSVISELVNGRSAFTWRCHTCDYFNRCAQNTGDHIDDVPEHSSQVNTKQYAEALDLPTKHIIFCKTCIHNQQLQNTLLAAHIPNDDAPDFAERYASAESFKRSLELQYPSVCDDCAPHVRAELEKQKQNSRQQALNAMIRRSSEEHQNPIGQTHASGIRRHFPSARVAVTTVFLFYCLIANTRPQISQILQEQVITFMLASIALVPLNVAAENSRRVIGQGKYSLLQVMLFIWRSSVVYLLGTMTPTDDWYRPVAQIGIVVAVVLTLLASTTLQEITPRRINLVGSKAEFAALSGQNGHSLPVKQSTCSPTTPSFPPTATRSNASLTSNNRPSISHNSVATVLSEEMDWAPTTTTQAALDRNASPFARVADDPSVLTNSSGTLSFGFSTRRPNHFKNRGEYRVPQQTDYIEGSLGAQTFFGSEKATGLEDLFSQTLAIKDDSGLVEHMRRFGKALYGPHSSTSRWATFLAAFGFILVSSLDAFNSATLIMNAKVVKIVPLFLAAFAVYRLGRYRGDLISFMGFKQPSLSTEEFEQQFYAKASQILLTRRLQQLLIARILFFVLQMNWHRAIGLQESFPWLLDAPIWNNNISAMPGFILDAFTMVTILTQWKRPVQPQ